MTEIRNSIENVHTQFEEWLHGCFGSDADVEATRNLYNAVSAYLQATEDKNLENRIIAQCDRVVNEYPNIGKYDKGEMRG